MFTIITPNCCHMKDKGTADTSITTSEPTPTQVSYRCHIFTQCYISRWYLWLWVCLCLKPVCSYGGSEQCRLL